MRLFLKTDAILKTWNSLLKWKRLSRVDLRDMLHVKILTLIYLYHLVDIKVSITKSIFFFSRILTFDLTKELIGHFVKIHAFSQLICLDRLIPHLGHYMSSAIESGLHNALYYKITVSKDGKNICNSLITDCGKKIILKAF